MEGQEGKNDELRGAFVEQSNSSDNELTFQEQTQSMFASESEWPQPDAKSSVELPTQASEEELSPSLLHACTTMV